ncbi:MAG: RNA methyltransferase [Acidobacteriota bacterium]
MLEGPHLLEDALAAGLDLEVVLATEAFLDSADGRTLEERVGDALVVVEANLLADLADADSPRGVLALANPAARDVPVRRPGTYLYVDGLQDPGNLGALARVAEGAGVDGLFLSTGCVASHHPRALRGSAGSLLRLPHRADARPDDVQALLGTEATWLKLATRGGQDLYTFTDPPSIRVLAVGAEGQGLSPEVEALAGLELSIPMGGDVESLNATVSAAVVLFEWRRGARPGGQS